MVPSVGWPGEPLNQECNITIALAAWPCVVVVAAAHYCALSFFIEFFGKVARRSSCFRRIRKFVRPNHHRGSNMTWHCNGATNQEMVDKLREAKILTTKTAETAMLAVDRGRYCHEEYPYLDRPRRIGYNVTISAPHMHAYALSILSEQLGEGARALDVGSGSGYLTACMAFMIGPRGRVIGLEHIPELIEISTKNVGDDFPQFIKDGRITFIEGDGRRGYPEGAPYDAIHVGAAAETLPKQLIEQLAPGGRMLCPVVAFEGFQRFQVLVQIDKSTDGSISTQKLMHVSYVLLTDPVTQLMAK